MLEQVELDVRGVEDAHRGTVCLQVLSDGADRFAAGEIADHGHDQVARLELFQPLERLFGREITPVLAAIVGLEHEIGEAGKPAMRIGIAQLGSCIEERPLNPVESGDVAAR